MTIEETVRYLEEQHAIITNRRRETTLRIISAVKEELQRLDPIIRFMLKNGMYFYNEKLPDKKTTKGVILGRAAHVSTQLIVHTGRYDRWIDYVDSTSDTIIAEMITYDSFFATCDLSLVDAGIAYVRNFHETYVQDMNEQLSECEAFIEKMERRSEN